MTYEEQIAAIKADQLGKLHREDDHGVMDCAADLREIKAEKRGYEKGYEDARRKFEKATTSTISGEPERLYYR